jgi:hypothetical protein
VFKLLTSAQKLGRCQTDIWAVDVSFALYGNACAPKVQVVTSCRKQLYVKPRIKWRLVYVFGIALKPSKYICELMAGAGYN